MESVAVAYPPEEPSKPVTSAVILAAGNGSRIRGAHTTTPKPLLMVGGLSLVERSILTLHAAGVRQFRVVVGAEGETVMAAVRQSKTLHGLSIECLRCPDYARGNGVSLAAGVAGLEGPFLVAMADHVTTPSTIEHFLAQVSRTPTVPYLAVDQEIDHIYDVADATKVATDRGRIRMIGKALKTFDAIDMGLFYFPDGAAETIRTAVAHGAHSVSAIVERINRTGGFWIAPLPQPVWQDVDTPAMAREAERQLLRSLRKPTDGLVSRWLNRPLSLQVSRLLARWKIAPNTVTTGVFLLTLVAAWCAASTHYRWIAIGGLLFQLASILDGCDGELSRLTFRGSKFGAWYDTITDNIRYAIFFMALGISGYRSSGHTAYIWGLTLFPLGVTYMASMMARYTRSVNKATNLAVTARVEAHARETCGWWEKFAMPQRFLVKQDVSAFVAMACTLAGAPGLMFWFVCYALTIMTVSIARALNRTQTVSAGERPNLAFLLYLLGILLFGYLTSRMPLQTLMASLAEVGSGIWIVLAIAPPLWLAFSTLSLAVLIRHRIGFGDLFYNQLVGEGINTIVPLAGLAGEPYKVKHLSAWLPLDEASRVIVQNKLIHALSGPLMTAILGTLTLVSVPLSATMRATFIVATIVLYVMSMALFLVGLSKAPERLTGFVLTRLKILGVYESHRVNPRLFTISLLHKMVGRALIALEAIILLYLLGIPVTFGSVVTIEAFIAMTSIVFVVVPQGIGVNEVGIAGAFALLGIDPHLALTFGLIRRARVIFWALGSLLLHAVVSGIQQTSRPFSGSQRAYARGTLGRGSA
ncbi:MAG: flippase-like domain-containing protein [Deltaproteobacteria bacterium]|nr:flippase-like domain-containing protein [Deltaproteobacteria bacterium]